MILVEGVGDVALLLVDAEGAEQFLRQVGQRHAAPRRHQLAQRHVGDGAHGGVHENDVVELIGQILVGAQVVDGLAHGPVLRHRDHLALHQASGGILGIAQRLFDRDPVHGRQRVEDRLLLRLFEILEKVDDIVRLEFADGLGEDLGGQAGDDVCAHAFVEFAEDLAVEFAAVELDQAPALTAFELFQEVGDVGRVQRLHQAGQKRRVACLHGLAHSADGLAVERVGVVLAQFDRGVFFGHSLPSRLRWRGP